MTATSIYEQATRGGDPVDFDDFDDVAAEEEYQRDRAEAARLGVSMSDFFQYQIDMDAMADERMDEEAERAFCEWCDQMERETAGRV